MPATRLIVWERRGPLASETSRHLDSLPAELVPVGDMDDLLAAIQKASFPVVLLDRATLGEKLPDAIAAASGADAWIVVVGPASADECRRDRDLGAHLLLAEIPERLVWGGTLRRLVNASQERMKQTTAPTKR